MCWDLIGPFRLSHSIISDSLIMSVRLSRFGRLKKRKPLQHPHHPVVQHPVQHVQQPMQMRRLALTCRPVHQCRPMHQCAGGRWRGRGRGRGRRRWPSDRKDAQTGRRRSLHWPAIMIYQEPDTHFIGNRMIFLKRHDFLYCTGGRIIL